LIVIFIYSEILYVSVISPVKEHFLHLYSI